MCVGNVVETTQSPSVKNKTRLLNVDNKTRLLNVDQNRIDSLHVLDVAMKVDDTQLTQFYYCGTSKVDTEHKSARTPSQAVAGPLACHPAAAPATCAQHNTSRHRH